MHGAHRTPQHRNGDFHWFLRTRFCRVIAQIVIAALLLVDVPVPTDYRAVAEATGSSSFQPRILALAPSCVARGANFKIILDKHSGVQRSRISLIGTPDGSMAYPLGQHNHNYSFQKISRSIRVRPTYNPTVPRLSARIKFSVNKPMSRELPLVCITPATVCRDGW